MSTSRQEQPQADRSARPEPGLPGRRISRRAAVAAVIEAVVVAGLYGCGKKSSSTTGSIGSDTTTSATTTTAVTTSTAAPASSATVASSTTAAASTPAASSKVRKYQLSVRSILCTGSRSELDDDIYLTSAIVSSNPDYSAFSDEGASTVHLGSFDESFVYDLVNLAYTVEVPDDGVLSWTTFATNTQHEPGALTTIRDFVHQVAAGGTGSPGNGDRDAAIGAAANLGFALLTDPTLLGVLTAGAKTLIQEVAKALTTNCDGPVGGGLLVFGAKQLRQITAQHPWQLCKQYNVPPASQSHCGSKDGPNYTFCYEIIDLSQPYVTSVPKVTGLDFEDAKKRAAASGLGIRLLHTAYSYKDFDGEKVVSQIPAPDYVTSSSDSIWVSTERSFQHKPVTCLPAKPCPHTQ